MIERLKYLFGEEWFNLLEPFLLSPKFAAINRYILNERKLGKVIYPEAGSDDNFRCFRYSQPSKIKIVVIGNPINYDEYFDGLLFSESKRLEPTDFMRSIIKSGVDKDNRDNYPDWESLANGLDLMDLSRWANQGVFLLSPELTYEKDCPLAHLPLWNEFIKEVIKILNTYNNICWVLIGQNNWAFESILNPLHRKIKTHTFTRDKNMLDVVFSSTNEYLDLINKKNILW